MAKSDLNPAFGPHIDIQILQLEHAGFPLAPCSVAPEGCNKGGFADPSNVRLRLWTPIIFYFILP